MNHLHQLARRIRAELAEIAWVVQRVESGWERAQQSNDDHYLVMNTPALFSRAQAEVLAFAAFLEQRS